MSRPTDSTEWELPTERESGFEEIHAHPTAQRIRRREAAARVRARRLALLDVGLGALLALIGILIAPGLAIVALFAIPLLIGCLYSYLSARTGWRLRLPRRRGRGRRRSTELRPPRRHDHRR